MTKRIPYSLINSILSKTNIVDLINKRIKLKKQGKNFYAYCPFHQEKHPSFSVSLEKQFYYCFSCGAHGNAIDFLIHYEHLEFIESIKELASINGIYLTFKNNSILNEKKNEEQKELYNMMNILSRFYHKNLTEQTSLKAQQYLHTRGINNSTIKQFKIGFASNKWKNILEKFGISDKNQKILTRIGMLVINNNGHTYDRFRERIMFPIHNKTGQVIAFGGRALNNNNTPKYLNSPDTNLFQKRRHLYGLYELLKIHKTPPYILLVEGYIDVISLTQFGIHYVVSSLGTSTTKTHIERLYHNTNQIICCYDGDYSGYIAAWRTLKNTLPYLTDTRTLSFIFLPHKEDPDTLIRKIGKENFLKYIKHAQPLSNFLFNTLLKKTNIQTIEGRSKLGYLALPIINTIPGKILRVQLLQKLGNKIGILDENKLNALSTKIISYKKNYPPIKNNKINILISLLIQKPKLYQLISIQDNELKKIKKNNTILLIELITFCKNYPNSTSAEILEYYRHKKFYKEIKKLAMWNHMIADHTLEQTFIDTLSNLNNSILEEEQEKLIAKARIKKLIKKEQEKLWFINKKLAKINN